MRGNSSHSSVDAVTPTSRALQMHRMCIVLSAPQVHSASLLYGSKKWQMFIKNFQLYVWPWKDWLNKGKSLGFSIGLNLSLIFWLWWFISQQLLYPLPNPFLPKAQWGTKGGSAGSQCCFWSELHLFHFVLLYILRDLLYLAPQLTMGEVAAFRSHSLQYSQGCLPSCLQAKQMKASSLTDKQNCHIYGHWDYSNWLNLEPAQKDNIIFILFLPFVWHLEHEKKIPWLWLIIAI